MRQVGAVNRPAYHYERIRGHKLWYQYHSAVTLRLGNLTANTVRSTGQHRKQSCDTSSDLSITPEPPLPQNT